MSLAGQFFDNAAKISKKTYATLALGIGMLAAPSVAKSQNSEESMLIDTANNIRMHYDIKTNQTIVTQNEKIIDKFGMSKHYKKTINKPDRYTLLEQIEANGRAAGDSRMKKAAFWAHPAHALYAGFVMNSSNSPYFDGPSFIYGARVGLGGVNTSKNLYLKAGVETYFDDPRKFGGSVVYKNRQMIGFAGSTHIPNHAILGVGVTMGPHSPVIAKLEVGGDIPFSSTNNILNYANPYVSGEVGAKLFPKKVIGLEVFAGFKALKHNKENDIGALFFKENTKDYITQTSLGVKMTITLGNFLKDKQLGLKY